MYISKTLHMSESSTMTQITGIRAGTCGWLLCFDVSRVDSCQGHPGADGAEGGGGAGAVVVGVAGAVLGHHVSCRVLW